MFIGNTQIKEQFFGDTPIKSIWLGNIQVWNNTYSYSISDIKITYSEGEKIYCNGSNYAVITCTLKTYNGSTLVKTETNKPMNFTFNYPNVGSYCTVNDNMKISFNLNDYGTTDLTYHSDPITTTITPFINGITGNVIQLAIEPNMLVDKQFMGNTNYGYNYIGSTIPNYSTSIYLKLECKEVEKCIYKSGQYTLSEKAAIGYVIDEINKTYIGSNTYGLSVSVQANNNNFPVLYCYRITEHGDLDMYSPNDYYYYIMQHSNVNRNNKLSLYLDRQPITEDYYIETSTDIILMNDAHKDGYEYTMWSSNQSLRLSQENGVIFIEGISSSCEDWVMVEVDDGDGNCEEITFNILGI